MRTIIDEIKNIRFEQFETYNIEKLLGQPSDYSLCFTPPSLFRTLSSLFKILCIKEFKYIVHRETNSSPQILFIYNHLNKRKDLLESFLNITECAQFSQTLILTLTSIFDNIVDINFYKDIKVIRTWFKQLEQTQLSFKEKINITTHLYKCHKLKKNLDKLNCTKLNLIVVNYDSFFLDNFCVQYFQHKNTKTATLQHGIMISKRKGLENNIDFCGTEFKNSIADYLLAWNLFTKKQAIVSGIEENKIVIAGPIKCIKLNKVTNSLKKKNILGILLDGKFTEENNPNMIQIANLFCSQYNYKFILRYHPAYKGNEYDSFINKSVYLGNNTSILTDFVNEVDYILISNSTAYIELLYMGAKVIHFKCTPTTDKYRDLDIPSCSNAEELYQLTQNKEYLNHTVIDNLLSVTDIELSYKNFFSQFINNEN